ncbi:hypothetical protein IMCC21906_00576 [Spongiibacter sp. IMCC21906]|uniref:PA2779 family protein n=1 Tax=Spongiibacter sp. IMCC21906 TaxID=1620392 RepID=UPI00062DFEC9|nr:PA2779 family protein [Spongiibacter sp. IMCC21906]AKH68269.1 hypothetical protein IMCC21906_00576 [Spongiibacter sp. IMCC21906]
MRKTTQKSTAALIMSLFIAWAGLVSSAATAAVIDTEQMITQQQLASDKADMKQALAKGDVKERLLALGVSPEDVDSRIDSLTASELAMLQDKMDDMPAGSGALGLLALLVLIFFITDIIGVTDIFPFVNPAN